MVSQEQKKYKPPKLFTNASSVCFVRRIHEQDTTTPFNFKILFLKRNPALRSAAGFWAFPGGKVETQDFFEEYEEVMPTFVREQGKFYHDFDKRITCIRECFEETGILISTKPPSMDLRQELKTVYKDNFLKMCSEH